MKLTIEQVEHIARLARLELSDAEKESYQTELSAILSYVDRLQELDTETVAPTIHLTEMLTELRPDEIHACTPAERAALIAQFPAQKADLLSVPPVFAHYKE
jgi:aspartyl-tRNA(Asn)/glutamyl-tRNA(Gln) amidotransferase subunit C